MTRYEKFRWHRTGVIAVLLFDLGLSWGATPAQRPPKPQADAQAEEGPARAGTLGGQTIRGTISAISGDHLTLKSETGQTYQLVTSSNTRIMRQRQQVKLADLKPGDGVGAAGILDAPAHTFHAVFLFTVSAEDLRKAQENLGKTYITGRVTGIDELKLTVQRPDQVSQVIEVDEGTSFRRGGRGGGGGFGSSATSNDSPSQPGTTTPRTADPGGMITLADLKVGDTIFATGSVRNGSFHPSELRVGNPRRRRPDGESAKPPASTPPIPTQ